MDEIKEILVSLDSRLDMIWDAVSDSDQHIQDIGGYGVAKSISDLAEVVESLKGLTDINGMSCDMFALGRKLDLLNSNIVALNETIKKESNLIRQEIHIHK